MLNDILDSGAEMLEKAGFVNIEAFDGGDAPGLGLHEWELPEWAATRNLGPEFKQPGVIYQKRIRN